MKGLLDFNLNFIQCHTNVIEAIIGIGANPVKHYFSSTVPFPYGGISSPKHGLKVHESHEWIRIRSKLPLCKARFGIFGEVEMPGQEEHQFI